MLQDMHTELQDVMGQSFGVPDDIDEDDLMGELDALEDELAQEAENPAESGVPSYLQVLRAASPSNLLCTSLNPCHRHRSIYDPCHQQLCLSESWGLHVQETDLPEAPAASTHAARPQAYAAGPQDEFGLPAVPQRT